MHNVNKITISNYSYWVKKLIIWKGNKTVTMSPQQSLNVISHQEKTFEEIKI